MADKSKIQWTDATWNIAVGCTKVDEDCKFCYMYRGSLGGTRYNPKAVRKTKTVFNFPLKYKNKISDSWDGRPLIFTSSLTDVFHEECDSFRNEVWDIIRKCPHLIFQILTKRPERIIDNLPEDWGDGWDNVWIGTSVGSQESDQRIKYLLKCKAKVLFLSLEPLHGLVSLKDIRTINSKGEIISYHQILQEITNSGDSNRRKIDWVIVGGESGNENGKYKYRPCKIEWINKIIQDCKEFDTPVFVKQLGTYISKELNLHDRHGGNINEWPEELQIRQFPKVYDKVTI